NVTLQPNGKILVGGYGKYASTTGLDMIVLRYNSDGTIDSTFGVNGVVVIDYLGLDDGSNGSLGLTPARKIIVAGYVTVPNTGATGTHRVWGFSRLLTPESTPSIPEGSTYVGSGTFVDPGPDSPWTATVNYGDGTGDQPLTLNGSHFLLNHQYADN